MAVDNEKYRATGVVHQSLAEVDESGGFELTRVGGETQSSLRAQCRDEVDRIAGTGGAYDRSLPDWCPGGAGMEVSAHPRLITEVDVAPTAQPQCGWPDTLRSSIAPRLRDSVVGSPQRTLR